MGFGYRNQWSMVMFGAGSGKDWDVDLSQIPVEQPSSKYTVDGSEIRL